MATVAIRAFALGDESALAAILADAIDGLAAGEYSAAQRAVWRARAPGPEALAALYTDGRDALVAELGSAPVGFSDVAADGHIGFLYVSPAAARRGVARQLLGALERSARASGIPRLYAEASETALPAFVHCGFAHVARRALEIDGVAIHNHAVEKRL